MVSYFSFGSEHVPCVSRFKFVEKEMSDPSKQGRALNFMFALTTRASFEEKKD